MFTSLNLSLFWPILKLEYIITEVTLPTQPLVYIQDEGSKICGTNFMFEYI